MRMNADKREYNNTDVYSDLSTSYSATYAVPDTQEFTLDSISKKLGAIAPAEDNAAVQANADIMPSSQTQQMSYQRHYQSNTATAKKVSTKAKVACVSYVAVVLLLVLGITLTAVAVSGVFGETLQISANYAEVADKVAALDEQLAQEDYGALAERAEELGYIDASESNTQMYTEVETRPAQNFNIETNWFDSLCDWLSGAFGG
ncbi:MAG TPA: hypothetical protein IAC72_01250 [Candidatus Fimimonas merdipullorum]|uniref:Uncharacterized protein n=1 Tax=Candidatus Fimimonas merdipullorum TaxID=2840822 RepID=A0A9D1MW68_9BACT|nr:hypothetical protein [Candidatus Fimimonas merdipullorum]